VVSSLNPSLRKLAERLGCDPMTVLYHFGSKDGLLRAVADALVATLEAPALTDDWQGCLREVGNAYRRLAHRYPKVYPLLIRFHATGPADYRLGEVVYAAINRSGLSPEHVAHYGLGFFSLVIGFALCEVEGMLRRMTPEETSEMLDLSTEDYPVIRELVPAFAELSTDALFGAVLSAYLGGIAVEAKRARQQEGG